MSRRLMVAAMVVILFPAAHVLAEECMDCVQRKTEHYTPHFWVAYEALCCDVPCVGEGYEMKDENVGWGCRTLQVNNELAQGTMCNSSDDDKNCPEPPPPPDPPVDNGGGWSDGGGGSPIILDLGDDTYRLTSVSDGVRFDLRSEGQMSQMAWTRLGIENAFLAIDRNGNGRIDNGAELFGNYTPLRSGQIAQNGFEALAELDANHDGVLNASDGAWSALLLWTDRNHDGASTVDELQAIAGSAITALEIDPKTVGRKDQWGNRFRYMAHFRYREAAAEKRRTYYDVFFRMAE